jgi:hypothetical protein
MSNRTGVFIALAALGLACSGISSAQTRDPRIGHWHEQRGPGSFGLHLTYEDLGAGRFRFTIGAHRMPVDQQIVEGKCDGGTYPFLDGNGTPSGNTLSCRITGPLTVEYLYTQGDKTVWATSTGIEAVSADGNTLTVDGTHRDKDGRVVEERHARYSRRDDEPRAN